MMRVLSGISILCAIPGGFALAIPMTRLRWIWASIGSWMYPKSWDGRVYSVCSPFEKSF